MSRTVLHLDSGSGRGGSSRSLGLLAKALHDADAFARNYDQAATTWQPLVALQEGSPMADVLAAQGIRTIHLRRLPTFRPSPRNSAILKLRFWAHYLSETNAMARLRDEAKAAGTALVHINHENTAEVGFRLASNLNVPSICHLRGSLPDNRWTDKLLLRVAARADAVVAISEPVAERFGEITGRKAHVVLNPAARPGATTPFPLPGPEKDFTVLALGHVSPARGTDKVLEVASVLRARGVKNFRFIICGKDSIARVEQFLS